MTRNKISLTRPLPESYRNSLRQIAGVREVLISDWFGGTYGVPQIVKPNAEPYFDGLIGKRIIRIDDNRVIADIHRVSIAVLAGRHSDI